MPEPRAWLMKSEPEVFSFEDLQRAPRRRTLWDGVRNYQARNLLRDEVRVGDGVLFYHSNASPPGVAGVARVVRAAYPDPTQFDPKDDHFDSGSLREDPRWLAIDVEAVGPLPEFVSLERLRAEPRLADMGVLRRGNRLSVQPVKPAEWRVVLALGGLGPPRKPGRKA